MPRANLYVDRIDFSRYEGECTRCGAHSCRELVEKLSRSLPAVPSLQHPRPVDAGLVEINEPGPGDPVLVTGNSALTQEVLLAVLSTTASPFFVLFSDTRGDTFDMSLILGSFTPGRLAAAVERHGVKERSGSSTLVLPGLAAALRDDVASAAGLPVEVGPVCAAELPLFFGDRWA